MWKRNKVMAENRVDAPVVTLKPSIWMILASFSLRVLDSLTDESFLLFRRNGLLFMCRKIFLGIASITFPESVAHSSVIIFRELILHSYNSLC